MLAPDSDPPTNKAVFHIAWPLTLKAIMLHGIVVIDAILVSPLGEPALAAMGLATAVAGFVLGILLAFANATQIRVAQAYGTRDRMLLKSALVPGLVVSIGVALLGIGLIWTIGGPLLRTVGHAPLIVEQAWDYLAVFSIVLLGESIALGLSGYFNGCGDTRLPLYSYLLGVPVNVLSSLVLIHGFLGLPALGLVGAAIGSAIGVSLQAAFLAFALHRRERATLAAAGWRSGTFGATLGRYLSFALPIAATFGSATVAIHVCALIYAQLSVTEFAALTLVNPWVQVAGTVGMCWAQATGIVVAQLLGQHRSPQVLDAFLSRAWRIAFVAAGAVAALYLSVCLASPWIYPGLDPATRATLFSFLPVLLLLPFPKQSNAMCGNTLRAGGETIYVMHIFVWSQWLFRVPATALMVLVFDLSATWVFSLLLIEELVKFPAFHLRLFKGHWKRGEVLA